VSEAPAPVSVHPKPRAKDRIEYPYVRNMAWLCVVLTFVPSGFGLLTASIGSTFVGNPFAFDDHMVYAAWMRQGMEGRLLMDNRFAVEAQPGLTVHLYFFLLGLIAKLVGVAWSSALAQAAFTFAFVWLVYGLIRRVTQDIFIIKVAMGLVCFGGGLGYLVWHTYGREIVAGASPLKGLMGGRLPVDVWQPEAFVFPSMLTNGLFMVSLCLILAVFNAVLDARENWNAAGVGAACLAVLMNIHSYDVLLIGLVMVAFVGGLAATKVLTGPWLLRGGVIALGALPPALWFLHVLKQDEVFRARAATETYSATFNQLFWGFAPLFVLGIVGLYSIPKEDGATPRLRQAAMGAGAFLLALLLASGKDPGAYWLSMGPWVAVYAVAVAVALGGAGKNPALNLILAWALVGLVAPYFPQLFQRKLLMGLSIPWAILAAYGLAALVRPLEDRGTRNLVTVLAIVVVCGSSMRWVERQFSLIRRNVSNTTVHAPYISSDVSRIVDYLNGIPGRKVVLAIPGVPNPVPNTPDAFNTPYIPDLNPVISGLSGAYSYAGHWSETPDYLKKRDRALMLFLPDTPMEVRRRILEESGADYVVAPIPEAFPDLADVTSLGQVVLDGTQFRLIRVR